MSYALRFVATELRLSAKCCTDVTRTRSTQLIDATPLDLEESTINFGFHYIKSETCILSPKIFNKHRMKKAYNYSQVLKVSSCFVHYFSLWTAPK